MSIQSLKKDILELKRVAALENKQAEDVRIKNMTDEELQEEIKKELEKLGFESEEDFYEAAKKFILEKDEHANVSHDFAISERIFEMFKDLKLFEEFIIKYSRVELTE